MHDYFFVQFVFCSKIFSYLLIKLFSPSHSSQTQQLHRVLTVDMLKSDADGVTNVLSDALFESFEFADPLWHGVDFLPKFLEMARIQ